MTSYTIELSSVTDPRGRGSRYVSELELAQLGWRSADSQQWVPRAASLDTIDKDDRDIAVSLFVDDSFSFWLEPQII